MSKVDIIKLITSNDNKKTSNLINRSGDVVADNKYELLNLCINLLNFEIFKVIDRIDTTVNIDSNELFQTMCNVNFKNIIKVNDEVYLFFTYLYKKTKTGLDVNQCVYNLLNNDNKLVLLEYLIQNKPPKQLNTKLILEIMIKNGVYINILYLLSKVKLEITISFFFELIYNILRFTLDEKEQNDVIVIIDKFKIDYGQVTNVRYMNKLYLLLSQYGNVIVYDYFNLKKPNNDENKKLCLEFAKMNNQYKFIENYWPEDEEDKQYKEIEANINKLLST